MARRRDLVRAAAEGRTLHLEGDIAFNRPAEQILSLGAAVLPDIETILRSRTAGTRAAAGELHGLPALLAVYLRITAEADASRAARLFESLKGPIREEAVRAILLRWGPARGRRSNPLPPPLKAFARTLLSRGSPVEKDLAMRLLDHLAHAKAAI
jgi:hypothetical protein